MKCEVNSPFYRFRIGFDKFQACIFGEISFWKGVFWAKICHFHKGWDFVYMHKTPYRVVINNIYFDNSL